MATQTLATADPIMKDLYTEPVIEAVNYKTWFLDTIIRDSDSVDFTGRRAVFPVHSAPNLSSTSITDGGTLPVPGVQGYDDGIVNIKYHAAGMEITDQAAKMARKNDGAFINLLDEDSKRMAKDLRKRINTDVFGDGFGTLATLAAVATASTAVTVNSTQYLVVGQVIDIRTVATGALENAGNVNLTITAINQTTKVVTLSGPVTASTGTSGVYLSGSYGLQSEGLRRITGSARTLHGINSATPGNEFWNGYQKDAAGAVAGESLFVELADLIGAAGNGDVSWFITSRGIRRRLANTYTSLKRFNDARAVEIHGGYTAIFVNEIPVLADDDAIRGWVFAGNNDAFKWFEVDKPDWLQDEDGRIWQLADGSVAGQKKAAWQAWFVWYATLGGVTPNQTGRIINAQDD